MSIWYKSVLFFYMVVNLQALKLQSGEKKNMDASMVLFC